MVLRELDVDITPVLTGAGIIGLAVGFGAQTLVKDIISGLFLIAEDQVRARRCRRDQRHRRHGRGDQPADDRAARSRRRRSTHPNGEIRTLANKSKDFSYYVIDIGVGYDDDTDRVVEVVRDVGRAS